MTLLEIDLDMLIRFIELTGFPSLFQFSNNLFKDFHYLQKTLAFVTLDVQFHSAVRTNGNFKFSVRHLSRL